MSDQDTKAATIAACYGKRQIADWLVRAETDRLRYRAALQEIARWDSFKTLGYEGPKRVAVEALAALPAKSKEME